MEKITCSRAGQSDTRMTDGAFVQKPNTARSLNYLRAANWRMSLKKGQTLVRGQRENLERKFNSIIIVINFTYMFKSKNDEICILIFVNKTDNLRMLLTQA